MARYALVIGISEYQSPRLGNLQKPVADAEAVAQILEQYGDFQSVKRFPVRWKDQNSAELATKKVTGVELGRELKTFLQEQAAHHEALIYFSGHGFTAYDNLGQQKGYLAASDCQVEVGENHQVSEQRYGISLDSFNELIRDSQLSSLVVLLDCCHSGYFLERQLIKQTLTAFSSQKDYYLITACRSYEDALAIKTEEYSIFTNIVLKGLAAENASRNRRISGDRLFDYVSSELKAVFQEPIRMGWGRSITLVTYPQLETTPEEENEFNRENPYRGLYSFESEQEKYFCGRVQAVRALLDRLSNNRFLSVIGPSGCGKSSLVKAGLLPHLERDWLLGSSQWGIETFTPGKNPLAKLIEILDRQHRQNQPFVLFIDQMEEIFTLCEDDTERQSFIRLMAEEATNSQRLTRVIVAIRTDFLDRCAAYPEVADLINRTQPTTYIVAPLSRPELEEAIKKPASLHGVKFQGGLISQIADDVDDQPGALPLLQYALKELWRVSIEKPETPEPRLTHKGYEEIGGVKGALENRANLLYQSFSSTDQLFVHQMFLELVQLGEENQVTRRRASWERLEAIADYIDQLRRVVGLLADQRLIVTDKDTVEVAHEALLTEWTLLRGWIEENRENIRLSRLLETECREWQQRFKKSDEALLTGAKLAAIAEWKEKNKPKLPVEESEFLRKSLAKRDKEIQEELEQERQLREAAEARAKAEAEKAEQERVAALAKIETALEAEARAKAEAREAEAKTKVQKQRTRFAIAAGTLVTFILGLGLLTQKLTLDRKQREVIATVALISRSEELLKNGNQLEAAIASIQTLKQLKDIGSADMAILARLKAVLDSVQERNRLEGHTRGVSTAAFNPKYPLIASGSSDKTVRLWKLNGIPLKTPNPMKHNKEVWTISFSPNGEYIASGSADKTIKLWKKDGTYITTLNGHEEDVNYVSFSPDSKTLISASNDKTIRLWKIYANSSEIKLKSTTIIKGHTGRVWSVEYSPDGQLIASASDDGTIRIWNKDGKFITALKGHTAAVKSASFGSDSKTVVSVSEDSKIKIWRWKTNLKNWSSETLTTESNRAYLVKFSPDYKLIAATSADGTIKLWTASTKKYLPSIGRHRDLIYDLSFSTDGKQIVTASRDKTIRIWRIDSNNEKASNITIDNLLLQGCNHIYEYLQSNQKTQIEYEGIRNSCRSS